ncbi:hypothetical protein [Paenibacillus periandrae]|uniref:hypothetical protein n=1 Tax=Paenibacillus periandrae TaxID=1761741 RepID=UPI001F08B8D8|nr:hypothetical protein [Paenibacillus periandrae]
MLLIKGYFGSLGILTVCYYFARSHDIQVYNMLPIGVSLVVWGVGLILLIIKKELYQNFFRVTSSLLQLCMPFLLLNYINGFYNYNSEIIKIIPFKSELIVFISIVLMIVIQIIRFIKLGNMASLESYISMPAIISISLAVLYTNVIISTLQYDDFHMGEIMLPWHQLFQFNQRYNVDFVSVQGLLGVLYSGINAILFDGSIASFNLSLIATPGIIGVVILILIFKIYGRQLALFFSVIYLPVAASPILSRFYFVLPLILILFHPKLHKRPLLHVIIWFWLSALHCFYNTTAGTALTLATIPYMAYIIISNMKNITEYIQNHIYRVSILLVVHLIILIYLSSSIIGTIEFLIDNASSNSLAYGVPFFSDIQAIPNMFPQWFHSTQINRLIWESIRVGGWLGTSFLFVFYIFKVIASKDKHNREILLFLFCMIVFLILVIPYSLGRIDPASMKRSGSVSLFCFSVLLPFFFYLRSIQHIPKCGTMLLLGGVLGIGTLFVQADYSQYPKKLIHTTDVPQSFNLIDGSELNLPNLGKIFVDPTRIDELSRINSIMNVLLKKNETFADLTNRSLLYVVLDKKVPSLYSADYLAANELIQEKVINHLASDKPPVVFIGPAIRHDGGPASLRSYRIYRWFLEKGYKYYEQNELQFLIRPDRFDDLGFVSQDNGKNTEQLAKVFGLNDMSFIPVAWGRSLKEMSGRFYVANIKTALANINQINTDTDGWNYVNGNDPYLTWGLLEPVSGFNADFVAFNIQLKEPIKHDFRFQVFWDTNGTLIPENSFTFIGKEGTVLMPLGSNPKWLLNDKIQYIRIDVDDLQVPFKITDLKFLKLIK